MTKYEIRTPQGNYGEAFSAAGARRLAAEAVQLGLLPVSIWANGRDLTAAAYDEADEADEAAREQAAREVQP